MKMLFTISGAHWSFIFLIQSFRGPGSSSESLIVFLRPSQFSLALSFSLFVMLFGLIDLGRHF